jgi:hypothetical protein
MNILSFEDGERMSPQSCGGVISCQVVDLWYRRAGSQDYGKQIISTDRGDGSRQNKKKAVRMGREICISCSDDGGKRNWR